MRRGLVLIIVLVAVVFLSLGAYTFTDLMVAHRQSSDLAGKQLQARMCVDSGVDAVRLLLRQDPQTVTDSGGFFDNPTKFKALNVIYAETPEDRGNVTIIAPNIDDEGGLVGVRYGLEDESTRLNLNTLVKVDTMQPGAGRQMLMALPQMTEDVADAILDWLDADSEAREQGAEADHYSGLNPPYAPKNGPLDTVEELLLVRGVTPQMLFGLDANRNGRLDPAESTTDANHPANSDLALARGWSAFLTLHSLEKNVTPDGKPRINLNMANMDLLYQQLAEVFPPEWATFIVVYRQNGPSGGTAASLLGAATAAAAGTGGGNNTGAGANANPGGGNQTGGNPGSANPGSANPGGTNQAGNTQTGGNQAATGGNRGGAGATSGTGATGSGGAQPNPNAKNEARAPDLTKPGRFPIVQVLDLIGAEATATMPGDSASTVIASPFPNELIAMGVYLPTLLDHVTVNKSTTIPGRININQASATVIRGIPNMTPELADLIISRRRRSGEDDDGSRRHETWLLTQGVCELDQMRQLAPFVTCRGSVYRAQVVGYFENGSAASRAEVIWETISPMPRVLFWRDLSHLGRGYTLETLGAEYTEISN